MRPNHRSEETSVTLGTVAVILKLLWCIVLGLTAIVWVPIFGTMALRGSPAPLEALQDWLDSLAAQAADLAHRANRLTDDTEKEPPT